MEVDAWLGWVAERVLEGEGERLGLGGFCKKRVSLGLRLTEGRRGLVSGPAPSEAP